LPNVLESLGNRHLVFKAKARFSWGKGKSQVKILRVGWVLGGFLSLVLSMPAQTFTTLHSFDGTDGQDSYAGLVQAIDGNLYGTTEFGGAGSACKFNCGTVFKITPSGMLTTLHFFGNTDGNVPSAGLVQATNGNLYGTTSAGGANNDGTVFRITPSGTLTTLHSFVGTDGYGPNAGLVQATNGNLYGTTGGGGSSNNCVNGCGTIFKITPSGTLTTLHSFDGTDGAYPEGLVLATNGDFYGTTGGGYNHGCSGGCGTIFKITPSGTLTTLHGFEGLEDGANPSGLVQAIDGNLYGTTTFGGSRNCNYGGCGTVFKITPSGTLTTLYFFDGGTDGSTPWAGLVQATDGKLYGTTLIGGPNDAGTIFEITTSGTLTTLYTFCLQNGCPDGDGPRGELVQATNGTFYGTTFAGGANGDGTVFSLSAGLGPFVETLPTAGKVGAAVKILGTKLTGATSVTFNGSVAVFKVVSKSLITTTVPTGASTGTVEVTTPKGTLKSNVVFRVKK
jgi:uncharacterized repeat protein (TIGR03803 family)